MKNELFRILDENFIYNLLINSVLTFEINKIIYAKKVLHTESKGGILVLFRVKNNNQTR